MIITSSLFTIEMKRCEIDKNQNENFVHIYRTAECLGIQNIYVVVNVEMKNTHIHKKITRVNITITHKQNQSSSSSSVNFLLI